MFTSYEAELIFTMTRIRQLFTLLLLGAGMSTLAQTTPGPSKTPGAAKKAPFQQKDTVYWIRQFVNDFGDAVYQKEHRQKQRLL